jgi:hypothetical protein
LYIDVAHAPSRRRGVWLVIVESDEGSRRYALRAVVRFGPDGFFVDEVSGAAQFSSILEELRSECERIASETLYVSDIVSAFVAAVKRRGGFHISKQGGAYFIPYTDENKHIIEVWRDFVHHLGGTAAVFAITGEWWEAEAVLKLFVQEMRDFAEELHVRLGRKIREETANELAEEIANTLRIIAIYRALIDFAGDELDEVEAQFKELLLNVESASVNPQISFV